MFFKGLILFFAVVVAILIGCAEEDQPYSEPFAVKVGLGTQCLSEANKNAKDFFQGKLSGKDVTEFWACTREAIRMFREHVKGHDKSRFSANELRNFMHKYFLGDIRISDELLRELMEVKRLFVGGDGLTVTHKELIKTMELTTVFRDITLRLRPHMETLFPSQDAEPLPPSEVGRVNESILALQVAFFEIGAHIEKNGVTYELSRFTNLLYELDKILETEEGSTFKKIIDWSVILPHLKAVFVGDPLHSIEATEWRRTLARFGELVGLYFRYINHIKEKKWSHGLAFQQTEKAIYSFLDMLELGVKERQEGLPPEVLDDFIHVIAEKGFLPFSLDPETLRHSWRLVTGRMLQRDLPTNRKNQHHLTVPKVQLLRAELKNWLTAQQDIIGGELLTWLTQKTCLGERPSDLSAGGEEVFRLVSCSPWSLMVEGGGKVLLSNSQKLISHDHESLTSLNWKRFLFRNLILVYSSDIQRKRDLVGLTKEELEVAYKDLKPILIDLSIVSEDNDNFHQKILFESDLFLPQSNGNGLLEYEEAVEYLFYALSGLEVSRTVFDDFVSKCKVYVEEGSGKRRIEANCFRKLFKERAGIHLRHMKELSEVIAHSSASTWLEFAKHLENTVRDGGFSNAPVSQGEVLELTVLLQFIETFMLRFDVDENGYVDRSEAVLAYHSVFGRVLEDIFEYIRPLQVEGEVLGLFTYLIKHGDFPDFEFDWSAMIEFLVWIRHPHEQGIAADRSDLALALSVLSQYKF